MSYDTTQEVQISTNTQTEGLGVFGPPTREQREQLKALSTELFNVSSKWKKFYDNGSQELLTKTVVETIPGKDGEPDTQKETQVPVLSANGKQQFKQVYYTPETLIAKLTKMKDIRDQFLAQMKEQQQKAAAKKEEEAKLKQIQEDLTGSAL